MNYTATRSIEFDAGHRVPYHHSKCRNPHGHRYRVEVTIQGPLVEDVSTEHGMVVDFGALKGLLTQEVHDRWDHAMVVWDQDTELIEALHGHGWRVVEVPTVPTAENLARLVWIELEPWVTKMWDGRVFIEVVRIWETPNAMAEFRP